MEGQTTQLSRKKGQTTIYKTLHRKLKAILFEIRNNLIAVYRYTEVALQNILPVCDHPSLAMYKYFNKRWQG
jgi:hypothetical protein